MRTVLSPQVQAPLRRGEIVWANLGRDARGTEIRKKRPVVVVSAYDFNQRRRGVTVAPITSRDLVANWGVWLPKSAVLNSALSHDEGFLDCGQLRTIFADVREFEKYRRESTYNDVCFNERCGRLQDRMRLDLALQIVINGRICVSSGNPSKHVPSFGSVVELELQRIQHGVNPDRRRAVVVSSPGVDSVRNTYGLNQVTVVPLEDPTYYNENYQQGVALIDISNTGSDNNNEPQKSLAICQEIYTIDWQCRNCKVVGQAHDLSMTKVERALREYLDLPSTAQ